MSLPDKSTSSPSQEWHFIALIRISRGQIFNNLPQNVIGVQKTQEQFGKRDRVRNKRRQFPFVSLISNYAEVGGNLVAIP